MVAAKVKLVFGIGARVRIRTNVKSYHNVLNAVQTIAAGLELILLACDSITLRRSIHYCTIITRL